MSLQAENPTVPEPEDLLAESLQTLYDYTPITLASAGAEFRFPLRRGAWQGAHLPPTNNRVADGASNGAEDGDTREREIVLTTPRTDAKNWALHADSVWTSALHIASHLDILQIPTHIGAARARGELPLRVLELGAGAGLPSIVLAATYEDIRVTATDYPDAELIKTLEENVARNDVRDRCRAVPYGWGSDVSVFEDEAKTGFDVVFAADTLWNSDLHPLFLHTLCKTLRRAPDTRAYLVAGLHTGRYTLRAFTDAIPAHGLTLESVVEREVNGTEMRAWDVGRAEGEDDRERRRWVVQMVIKWPLK